MKKHNLPKLSWYDGLLEIERAGVDGIRPFELKERLLLPQYGTSRLLDRMVKAGLIVRDDVKADGRGQVIRATQKGLETRKAMWPVYAKTLVASFLDQLSTSEMTEMARLLGKISSCENGYS